MVAGSWKVDVCEAVRALIPDRVDMLDVLNYIVRLAEGSERDGEPLLFTVEEWEEIV